MRIFPIVLMVLALTLIASVAEDKPNPKAVPAAPELHRLKTDELLKQARAIYDKANEDYLAAARGLAAADILLTDTEKQEETLPKSDDKLKSIEAARAKVEAAKKSLKHLQNRKALLDRSGPVLRRHSRHRSPFSTHSTT